MWLGLGAPGGRRASGEHRGRQDELRRSCVQLVVSQLVPRVRGTPVLARDVGTGRSGTVPGREAACVA